MTATKLLPLKTIILIVDDSEIDRLIYISYLQSNTKRSYEILEADTLKKGLELWQSQHPDAAQFLLRRSFCLSANYCYDYPCYEYRYGKFNHNQS